MFHSVELYYISAISLRLDAMTYGAETVYLGAISHDAEKKIQS
jgi:hypothetical protein